jgi:hypothetical protein
VVKDGDERLPTQLCVGAGYAFSGKITLVSQLEKDMLLPINARLGIEYEVVESLFLRTGLSSFNRTLSLGIGYAWRGFLVDISNQWNQRVGNSAAISLAYRFGKRKPRQ